jgi:hypothetical protein
MTGQLIVNRANAYGFRRGTPDHTLINSNQRT